MSSARKVLVFACLGFKRFTSLAETTRSLEKNTERNSTKVRLLTVKLFSLVEKLSMKTERIVNFSFPIQLSKCS